MRQPPHHLPGASAGSSYDAVPYESHAFPQTHPSRLATIARLFGMQPAPIEKARVLELGCSMGGNLVPMAEQLPAASFVGVDFSSVQVERARALAEAAQANNVRLEQRDILEIDERFGRFDYIIAHGVYSWVPDEVQAHVLRICRQNLAAAGVAYVSYNTNPGWRLRGTIRDLMCFRARKLSDPAERLRESREFLDFLVQSVPRQDSAYGILLRDELDQIHKEQDYYLLHDYLEDVNQAVYFHEFAQRAQQHDLQYLGEADYRAMWPRNFSQPIESMLARVSSDVVELEQYIDFLCNRTFRQTLLCHQSVALDRTPAPDRVRDLYVASQARPEGPAPCDVQSRQAVTFRGPTAATTVSEPILKAALLHLGEIWPQSVAFSALLAHARSQVVESSGATDVSPSALDDGGLADLLLQGYATGLVDLSVYAPPLALTVPERPVVSRSARYQATQGAEVANLRHESVRLTDVQRRILPHLDGSHDREALTDLFLSQAAQGLLNVQHEGSPVTDRARLREILANSMRENLASLARAALILA